DVDSDGDGFPDGLELLFGSDPFDAASVPDLRARGELLSATVSVRNTALASSGSQEVISGAVSVLNTFLPLTAPQQLISGAVSVLNTSLPSTTPQQVISSAVS